MGYAATIGSIKKAILEKLPVAELSYIRTTSTTAVTFLEKYLDMTGITYVTINFKSTVDAGFTGLLTVDHAGTSLFSPTLTAGVLYWNITNPVPAGGQKHGLFEIKALSSNAAHAVLIENLIINTSGV